MSGIHTENPLLARTGIPAWDQIKPEHVTPAVDAVLAESRDALAKVEQAASETTNVWQEVCAPLELVQQRLHRTWGPVRHLNGVMNTAELRAVFEQNIPKIVAFGLQSAQSLPVFNALKRLRGQPAEWDKLSPTQRRIIEKQILSAELSGVGLSGHAKDRFNEIERELSQSGTKFSNNVLDSSKAFELVLTKTEEIAGLPDHALELGHQNWRNAQAAKPNAEPVDAKASNWQMGPWRFTLDEPSYGPFMEFAQRRDLREKFYRARIARASTGELNNAPLMTKILELRREKAKLLGFKTYAELSVATKMAPSVDAVYGTLRELLAKSKKAGKTEMDSLRAFAKAHGEREEIIDWDLPYWAERMREETLGLREEELLPYFPMPIVLSGLFALVKRIFGVTVTAADGEAPVWHPDVRFFRIRDERGNPIAAFYFDAFSRPATKRGGAWMDRCLDRRVETLTNGKHEVQLPIAHLTCNGTPPIGNKPSLMSFSEVRTLFHEFGHGLQHMLTTVDHSEASGIRNVEWDAVELPSQFMENWLYDRATLASVTAHVETSEPLPDILIDKIIAARTYRAGYAMLRQLHFALTDLELHHKFNPETSAGSETPFDVDMRIARDVSILPPRPENRFLCSFMHIFSGGYAAGYYSYKWAEVLSADAFAAFEEAGLDRANEVASIGRRFRDTVLALGGSRPPLEVFAMFRGRPPSPDALIRHAGFSN